jgi:hypothetical protein
VGAATWAYADAASIALTPARAITIFNDFIEQFPSLDEQ